MRQKFIVGCFDQLTAAIESSRVAVLEVDENH
eukprot:IDg9367t1